MSYSSPPVPMKIVAKIWNGEFVDLNSLLPYRLGAPEPTLADALHGRSKETKQISTIEQWVVCFNAYMSVVALQQPHKLRDLLAYSTIIVKAANDYEGKPWLAYDIHFRTLAASMRLQTWGRVDQALWSQHFNRAGTHREGSEALSIGPYNQAPMTGAAATKTGLSSKGKERAGLYPRTPPICIKWNREDCHSASCSYRHICLACHGQHREQNCLNKANSSKPPKPFRKEGGGRD